VTHNARVLARAAEQHLSRWRNQRIAGANAELVIVAHGTGGLVAQYFTGILGGKDIVRSTVTFGTPFHGAVRALAMICDDRRASFVSRFGAEVYRTMPGLYDMLPTYRCVEVGDDRRRLSVADVASLGGSTEHTAAAAEASSKVRLADCGNLSAIVGVGQPTPQSVRIKDGAIEILFDLSEPDGTRSDLRGDSVVMTMAATREGANTSYVTQTHGALPREDHVVTTVTAELSHFGWRDPL
jgi:hypothetical protein